MSLIWTVCGCVIGCVLMDGMLAARCGCLSPYPPDENWLEENAPCEKPVSVFDGFDAWPYRNWLMEEAGRWIVELLDDSCILKRARMAQRECAMGTGEMLFWDKRLEIFELDPNKRRATALSDWAFDLETKTCSLLWCWWILLLMLRTGCGL